MQSRFRSPSPRTLLCLAIVSILPLAGCRPGPDDLLRKTIASENDAHSARAQNDVEGAHRAADQADASARRLEELAAADKAGRVDLHQKAVEARSAARSARDQAEIAAEEKQRREILNGFKVRTYRKARTLLLTTLLPPMAAAADHAATRGTNNLSAIEKSLAQQTWNIVCLAGVAAPRPDGEPDWPAAASQLREWTTNQTAEFRGFLGLTFVLLGQGDIALAEFEPVDAAAPGSTNAGPIHHAGRAVLYALQGWNHLSAAEAEAFCQCAPAAGAPINQEHLMALLHGIMAAQALAKGQFAKMDAELSRSIRSWPDNPVAVYLTGEKLAADGEWEKAARSLETQAAGTKDEWIAQRLAQRARDLRDGKGTAKALVLDSRFIAHFAARGFADAARDSTAARKLGTTIDEAKSFGRQLWEKLPLIGVPDPTAPESGTNNTATTPHPSARGH